MNDILTISINKNPFDYDTKKETSHLFAKAIIGDVTKDFQEVIINWARWATGHGRTAF